ncbi:hypothetical protein P0082_01790 [Candidatus Haliotispira prima]|uniref:Uncharacterized protein n=1 Tax=Candidatus Haliotispira prima TaxID=3034016 RepID=A0ABY8MHX1_9SPIO|nr:hypothetical protein P0082_01790 [Candidatus Haliotispira prima]
MPLSETSDPPAAPSPTKSITVNYSGLHYVHFTAEDLNVSADKTVGFLITPTDSSLSKAEAETKKGYITRKFTESKKLRNIFMFLHEGTAYELAAGSTDIPFAAGGTASDTSFETSDILQENTAYKIRMYDGDTISEKTFTTKSFSDGKTSSEGRVTFMGGLVAAVKANIENNPTGTEKVAAKAAVSLKIERKPAEIMLIPYADDAFGGQLVNYYENTFLRAGCSPACGTGVSGAYIYELRGLDIAIREANKIVSLVYIHSPQKKITPSDWSAKEGTDPEVLYNIEIISE